MIWPWKWQQVSSYLGRASPESLTICTSRPQRETRENHKEVNDLNPRERLATIMRQLRESHGLTVLDVTKRADFGSVARVSRLEDPDGILCDKDTLILLFGRVYPRAGSEIEAEAFRLWHELRALPTSRKDSARAEIAPATGE